MREKIFIPLLISALGSLHTGCASAPEVKKTTEAPAVDAEKEALKGEIATLKEKIQSLEAQLASTNQQLQTAELSVSSPVMESPVESIGEPVEASIAPSDPQSGFINDSAVNEFRLALVRFNSLQYAEAAQAFSAFLEKYPDHPLAGSAQYYVGECHYLNKDYKLAHRELTRVLNAYDRSVHVSDALRRLVEVETILKKPEDSARHRLLLTSLFPQSPAAGKLGAMAKAPELEAPVLDAPPERSSDPTAENPVGQAPEPAALDAPPATALVPTAPIPGESD